MFGLGNDSVQTLLGYTLQKDNVLGLAVAANTYF